MNDIQPICAPVFSWAALRLGSAVAAVGWLSLFALAVLALIVRFRVVSLSVNTVCAFAHVQWLFFLLTVGVHGFIISYAILSHGPPPMDYLMLCFGEVLIRLATGLLTITVLIAIVRWGSKQKPDVMPGAWLHGSMLVADVALLLALQMMVFSRIG